MSQVQSAVLGTVIVFGLFLIIACLMLDDLLGKESREEEAQLRRDRAAARSRARGHSTRERGENDASL